MIILADAPCSCKQLKMENCKKSGYNTETKRYSSLRGPVKLPPSSRPVSAARYALSLLESSTSSTALIDSSTSYRVSFGELWSRVDRLASYLHYSVGLSKKDTAFVLTSNSIHVPVLYLSLLSIGVVVSPANPVSTPTEIAHLLQLCTPTFVFATSATASKLPHPLITPTILIDTPQFESAITSTNLLPLQNLVVNQSDLAAILYSSGTTGKLKGVMLTHRNLIAVTAAYYSHSNMGRLNSSSPTVMLYTVPYFHVFGFFYCLKSLALGEAVLVMEMFELRAMLRAVQEFRVTHLAVAPPVIVALTKSGSRNEFDFDSVQGVLCGGAPLGKDVIAAFNKKFPSVVLSQGYGLTETTGGVFRMVSPEESARWGSVGRLVGGSEAKIVDPDTGDLMPPGRVGELWVRGPQVMKGYVGDPEATSATLTSDGWLKTGDICYIDDEGFLFVVDRLKELIKYKGYQVAPAELEQLLLSHPEIADAAVIPYPDEDAGEVPMACVVRQPNSNINTEDIIDFVAKQVAPYKKIRRVAFVTNVPRTRAGKILRKDLKKNVTATNVLCRM